MKVLSTFSGPDKTKGMNLILFDCSKERSYNHAYHERCLKKAIKEEVRKDKKASLGDKNIFSMARCVICYRQN